MRAFCRPTFSILTLLRVFPRPNPRPRGPTRPARAGSNRTHRVDVWTLLYKTVTGTKRRRMYMYVEAALDGMIILYILWGLWPRLYIFPQGSNLHFWVVLSSIRAA